MSRRGWQLKRPRIRRGGSYFSRGFAACYAILLYRRKKKVRLRKLQPYRKTSRMYTFLWTFLCTFKEVSVVSVKKKYNGIDCKASNNSNDERTTNSTSR